MIKNNKIYDVAIVGAGPAGSLAGMNLAQAGYDILIFEKEIFPRDKPCGGGISTRVLTRFPYLKNEIESVVLNSVYEVSLYSPKFNIVNSNSPEPFYLMVRRKDFDSVLFNKCIKSGATVYYSSKVNKIAITKEYVELITQNGLTFRAKAIIGADGINSIVARHTGLNLNWPKDKIAICLVKETDEEPEEVLNQKRMYVFYGYKGIPGYGWVFPKKQCINLGIGVLANNKNGITNLYREFIQELKKQKIISVSFNPEGFKGWTLPIGGPLSKTYSKRVVLCGDAAGFVNSYTAEGIFYSMISGEIAAKVLTKALKEDDLTEGRLAEYQKIWKQEIGGELEKSSLISQLLLKYPTRIERVIKIANRDSETRRILSQYSVGKVDYHTLRVFLLKQLLPLYLGWKLRKFFMKIKSYLKQ
jgi:geranylgeranyl reductase family protein